MWPWVLLAVVLIPVLLFVGCTALVGGAVSSVQEQRAGGTVKLGETFTYASGLALTVSPPKSYRANNDFTIQADESGFESTVTVVNGSKDPVAASLILPNATVNSAPAQQVFDEATLSTQDIAPGQKLAVPFRFKVKTGTTGPLQIAVSGALNEPVFFTGTLG